VRCSLLDIQDFGQFGLSYAAGFDNGLKQFKAGIDFTALTSLRSMQTASIKRRKIRRYSTRQQMPFQLNVMSI
jgi:hypothetical protein